MSQSDTSVQQPQPAARKPAGRSGLVLGVCLLAAGGAAAAWWLRAAPRGNAMSHVPKDSQLVANVKLRDLTEDIPALKRLMAHLYFRGGVNWKGEYGAGGRDLFDSAAIGARFGGDNLHVVAATQIKDDVEFNRDRAIGKPHAGFDKPAEPDAAFFVRTKADAFIGSVAVADGGTLVFSTERTAPAKGAAANNAGHPAAAGPLVQAASSSPLWFALILDEPVLKAVRERVVPELDGLSSRGKRVVGWVESKGDSFDLHLAIECADSATATKLAGDAKAAFVAQLDALANSRDDLKPAVEEIKGSLNVAARDSVAEAKATVSLGAVETALKELATALNTSIPSANSMFETPDGLMPKPKMMRGGG